MTQNEIIFETLEATGLNWTVAKEEMYLGNSKAIKDKFAVVRSDNQEPIGVVGNSYEFLQNKDAAQMVVETINGSFNKDDVFNHPWDNTGESGSLGSFGNIGGGSLKGGRAIFLQIELEKAFIGKSDINRYITVTNKHDGSGSVGFGSTNQVVCCANTFAMANKFLSKFRHSSSLQQRLDEAMELYKAALTHEERQMEVFEQAANTKFDKHHIEDIVKSVFGVTTDVKKEDVSTRKLNSIKKFSDDVMTSINEQGETLWALFNAATRYTNHSTNRRNKTESLIFGADAQIAEKAYKTMLGWLNVEMV